MCMLVIVAPPTVVGAWSMVFLLRLHVEYYTAYIMDKAQIGQMLLDHNYYYVMPSGTKMARPSSRKIAERLG